MKDLILTLSIKTKLPYELVHGLITEAMPLPGEKIEITQEKKNTALTAILFDMGERAGLNPDGEVACSMYEVREIMDRIWSVESTK